MGKEESPRKIPLVFFRTNTGGEPVRDWLKNLDKSRAPCDRHGPVTSAMALAGRYASLPPYGKRFVGSENRLAGKPHWRVLICLYHGHLVALHGFIKKTQTTPDDDLALARKRQKELQQ